MSTLQSFVIFAAVATPLNILMHYFLWMRLVRDSRLPPSWAKGLRYALTVMAVLVPAAMFAGRMLSPSSVGVLAWPAFIWMGFLFLMVMTLLVVEAAKRSGRAVLKLAKAEENIADPSRRLLLQRAVAGTAAAAVGGMTTYGVARQMDGAVVKHVDVTLEKLPAEMDGTSLVQMSDIHVGPTIGRRYIESLVEKTNRLKPAVICLTGDLVDGSVEELRRATEPLKDLVAKHGVYFVTGNHEYYSGVDEWLHELERLGIHVLRNERVQIGDGIELAGVNDFSADRFGESHAPNVMKALERRRGDRATILMAHQPRAWPEAAKLDVGLTLSGHTHGGQIWPWNHFVKLQTPFVEGLYRDGGSQLYVSPGTGYWGPPMRVGTTSEITRITLRSVDKMA